MTTATLYPITEGRRRRRSRLTTLRLLRLVREGSFPAPDGYPDAGVPIWCPRDVFAVMQPYAEREVGESFWILPLDSQHRLSSAGPTVITRGILNSSLVHPREVFLAAIAASAAAVILVHNHPSGDPTPSADDRAVTDQLTAAGRLLDIPVHDHVIVGHGRYESMAERGWIGRAHGNGQDARAGAAKAAPRLAASRARGLPTRWRAASAGPSGQCRWRLVRGGPRRSPRRCATAVRCS